MGTFPDSASCERITYALFVCYNTRHAQGVAIASRRSLYAVNKQFKHVRRMPPSLLHTLLDITSPICFSKTRSFPKNGEAGDVTFW
jgi:hypothetical protein